MIRTLGSDESLESLERKKRNQERKAFELCAKACGYHGPLVWNEQLQWYENTHDTALFAGFRMGLKYQGKNHGD